MAIIRLINGGDVLVKLDVPDAISAITIAAGSNDFVELPGEEGPIHVRPSSVIAVLESQERHSTGFRVAGGKG